MLLVHRSGIDLPPPSITDTDPVGFHYALRTFLFFSDLEVLLNIRHYGVSTISDVNDKTVVNISKECEYVKTLQDEVDRLKCVSYCPEYRLLFF